MKVFMLAILGSKEGRGLLKACSNGFFIHWLTMNMQNSVSGKVTGKWHKVNFSPQAMGVQHLSEKSLQVPWVLFNEPATNDTPQV